MIFFYFLIHIYTSQITLKLFGDSFIGYYYTDIFVGNPPQKQSLIIDTGSSQTIFPCKGCNNCSKHSNEYFNTNASKTLKIIKPQQKYFDWHCPNFDYFKICHFNADYVEGSVYEGYYALDQVRFQYKKDQKNFEAIFGCAQKELGEFSDQIADGILGIGFKKNPKITEPPNLIDLYFQQNKIQQIVSFCIAHKNGHLSLGKQNKELHFSNEKIQYISQQKTQDKFNFEIPITNIKVEEQSLQYNYQLVNGNGKTFFDTGTTFLYLNSQLMNLFIQAVNNFCNKSKQNCGQYNSYEECYFINKKLFENTRDFTKTFPVISFQFQNVVVRWLPEDYLIIPQESINHLCIGVKVNEQVILGSILMRNYDIIFDKQNNRIGFIRAKCQQNKNIQKLQEILNQIQSKKQQQTNQQQKQKNNLFNQQQIKLIQSFENIMICIIVTVILIFVLIKIRDKLERNQIEEQLELSLQQIQNQKVIINKQLYQINKIHQ